MYSVKQASEPLLVEEQCSGDHTSLYAVGFVYPLFFSEPGESNVSETKLCQEKINNGYLLINLHQGNSFVVAFVSADLVERC